MSNDEIVELELSLLLIKYGEKKVLKYLAKVNGLSIKELENKLQRVHQIKKKSSPGKKNHISKIIEEVINQQPQKSHILNLLYSRFQNKSFLPDLRDIKRLFNRHSVESENLRSRSTSALKVFKLLAGLNKNELEELAQEQDKTNFSSLGIISDEIMRHQT